MIGRYHHRLDVSVLFLAAGLVVCAGCGLQEYENRMKEVQKRLNYEAEENTYLEPRSVKLLEKEKPDKEADFHPDSLFFRPPQGISTAADDKYTGKSNRYPARSEASGFKEMFVAMVQSDDRDKFKNELVTEFHISATPKTTISATRFENDTPTQFEVYEMNTPTDSTRVFIRQGDRNFQVAIVYRIPAPASNWSNLEQKIVKSLASLMTGTAAFNQHRAYHPPPPPPVATGKR